MVWKPQCIRKTFVYFLNRCCSHAFTVTGKNPWKSPAADDQGQRAFPGPSQTAQPPLYRWKSLYPAAKLIKLSFYIILLYFIKFFINIISKNCFFPILFTLIHFRAMLQSTAINILKRGVLWTQESKRIPWNAGSPRKSLLWGADPAGKAQF